MKSEFIIPGVGSVKARRGVHVKMLSIRMAAGRGTWVNIPHGVSDRQVEGFLLSRREWMMQHARKVEEIEKETGLGLGINAEVRSRYYVLKVLPTSSARSSFRVEGNEARLFVPAGESQARVALLAGRVLVEIYKMESRLYLPGRVEELARKFGFSYRRLSFRDNLSNWGSCSGENNISLNVRLMKLPDELIDYVILHELCHTVEKNHSVRFWTLVQDVCPGYVELRGRLKTCSTRV
ncbi:MAG: M48 family metallopeptidase [Odoribacteraceae bacterium]|jgi:predicted metal-dependent hydrolase|nr:M48 family metallopeptidase [Odoribacteraceae bacterium]